MYRKVLMKTFLPNVRTRTASTSSVGQRLNGKTAIVTASTDGIGLAVARRLGQEGACVVVSSRKQAHVDAALSQLREDGLTATGRVCHVGKQEDRERLIQHALDEHGGIDILVSNAAANPHFGSILSCTEDQWDKIFDVNVKSSFLLAKDVIPHIEARGGGAVLFISSIAAYQAFEFLGPYSVSKTALAALTRALTPECAARGVRVNCLAPGIIKTKFSKELTASGPVSEALLGQVPLNRFGSPEEVAAAAAFLVSPDAAYVAGETLVAAGGMFSRL